jgi:molybdopterin-binding protein
VPGEPASLHARLNGSRPLPLIAAKELSMKISARNQIAGIVTAITPGAVNGTVKVDIGGTVVTASITEEAIAELGLVEGDRATVIVKASDVMIGK